MLLLISGATATVRRHVESRRLGHLLTPASGNSLRSTLATGLPWAADNSAFVGFDPAAFCAMLGRVAGKERCLFVACPDVVGDASRTLALFEVWQPIIASLQLPVALVGQDGLEALSVPWERIDSLFLGGSTDWKLSRAAAELAKEAKRREKWVHMGRCNTRRRLEHAFALGCDSVDGSGFSRWPDRRIPKALSWLAKLHGSAAEERGSETEDSSGRVFPLGRRFGEKMLGSGWVVEGASIGPDGYHLRTRYVPEPVACPQCGVDRWTSETVHRHGNTAMRLRDRPWQGKPVTLHVRRARYRCRECKATFLQPLPELSEYRGITNRFSAYLAEEAIRRGTAAVVAETGVGEKTVRDLARHHRNASRHTIGCPDR